MTKVNEMDGSSEFGMELTYDDLQEGDKAKAQYNGNIAKKSWFSQGESKSYAYYYDALSRLNEALYDNMPDAKICNFLSVNFIIGIINFRILLNNKLWNNI